MNRNVRLLLPIFIIPLFIPLTSLQAQDTFSPDRPGLGTGTYVIPPKTTYLESGFEYLQGETTEEFSFGQVLFRHGLTQGLEMRVQLNSFVYQTQPFDDETGVPDPGVGFKFNIVNKPWSSFSLSGLGSVTIPAGYSTFSDDKYHPSGTLLANYQVSELWSVTSNLSYTFGPHNTSDLWTVTLTPGFSIPDTQFSGYFGYAAFITEITNEHFLEAGATKLVNPALQLDVNTGIDLNSGNAFAGVGVALRF